MLRYRVRHGAYHDSIVLMQLRVALTELPGIADAGAVMGTPGNLEILEEGGLLPPDLPDLAADDLLFVVRTEEGAGEETAHVALDRVGELLTRRRTDGGPDFRPRSLASAVKLLPDARWVLVSVPGGHAAEVTLEALGLGRHVFLFSDHVPIEDEAAVKAEAAAKGLLVMGPDCGTACVAGAGLGFANRVRPGPIGLVAASGTGLQAVASRIHALGSGLSHALGTGGRDLSEAVGGATALQAIELLGRDPATEVLVLISKPPAPRVAAHVLAALQATANHTGKPAVVCLLGRALPFRRLGTLRFAVSLTEAAELAVAAVTSVAEPHEGSAVREPSAKPRRGSLRGLFSGGTLAQEALEGWTALFGPVESNLTAPGASAWDPSAPSSGHCLLDLGDDAFTAGRPHPMLDPTAVAERLEQETRDPAVAAVLLDVVLGDGAHPDPASVLAPAIREARSDGNRPEIVAVLVGTDDDPQDLDRQRQRLIDAGAQVFDNLPDAQAHLFTRFASPSEPVSNAAVRPVSMDALEAPLAAINVGVETFHDALLAQGVKTLQVEWRPPAGGDEGLAAILRRMKTPAGSTGG